MVFINNKWSHEELVEWVVLQSSVLCPLIFLICINDMPHSINSKTFCPRMITFVNCSTNLCELGALVKKILLTDAQNWFISTGVLLSEEQIVHILFSLKPNLLTVGGDLVQSEQFLGIHYDNQFLSRSYKYETTVGYLESSFSYRVRFGYSQSLC